MGVIERVVPRPAKSKTATRIPAPVLPLDTLLQGDCIAIMRSLPNMNLVVPCDFQEARKATKAAAAVEGPVYIRFGREDVPGASSAAWKWAGETSSGLSMEQLSASRSPW